VSTFTSRFFPQLEDFVQRELRKPPLMPVQQSAGHTGSQSSKRALGSVGFAEGEAALKPPDQRATPPPGAVQMLPTQRDANLITPAMMGEAEAIKEMSEMDDGDLLDAVNDKLGVVTDFLSLQVEVADASGGLVEAGHGLRQVSKHLNVLAKAGALREMYRALGRWSAVEKAWEAHERKPTKASARKVGREAGDMIGKFANGISKFLPPGLSDIVGMLEGLGPWLEIAAGNIVHNANKAKELMCEATGDEMDCN
jgi:hypothetical protein